MADRICSIESCGTKHYARGWCKRHYLRWFHHGDPAVGKFEVTQRGKGAEARFWTKVDKSGKCWLWTGSLSSKGYGHFGDGKRIVPAHRFSYQLANGDIPAGMQIDHICHTRNCVNPEHLRLATNKQNIENLSGARSDSASGIRGVRSVGSRWLAYVRHNGEFHNAGMFDTAELAEAAAIAKRNELFTHNDRDRLRV